MLPFRGPELSPGRVAAFLSSLAVSLVVSDGFRSVTGAPFVVAGKQRAPPRSFVISTTWAHKAPSPNLEDPRVKVMATFRASAQQFGVTAPSTHCSVAASAMQVRPYKV